MTDPMSPSVRGYVDGQLDSADRIAELERQLVEECAALSAIAYVAQDVEACKRWALAALAALDAGVECTECGQECSTTVGLHACTQCSRRDCIAIRGQVAEAQAKLKEWTARFERHLDEATKTITEMALERDALKATLSDTRERASMFYNKVHEALGTDGATVNAPERIMALKATVERARGVLQAIRDYFAVLQQRKWDVSQSPVEDGIRRLDAALAALNAGKEAPPP